MESHLTHSENTTLDRPDHENEHGGEKQSVMMKVKAKARKIKDTIKNRGRHHDDESQEKLTAVPHEEDEDEDEDDDDDEEEEVEVDVKKDPEVHGVPTHESHVARDPNLGLGGNQELINHEPNMERTDEPAEDNTRFGIPTSLGLMNHQPNVERIDETEKDNTGFGIPTSLGQMNHQPNVERIDEPEKDNTSHGLLHHEPNSGRSDEPVVGEDHTRVGVPTGHGLMQHQPNVEVSDAPDVGKDHTRLGVPTSHGAESVTPESEKITEAINLKEGVEAPRLSSKEGPLSGNYEAKVSDPTVAGAEEPHRIAPCLHSLDKMSLEDKPTLGSHDQVESHDEMLIDEAAFGSHDQLKSGQPGKYRDMPDDSPLITGEAVEHDISLQGGGYGEKLVNAKAPLADEVVAVKDADADKLGHGDEKIDRADDQTDQTNQTTYTEKAYSAASMLAGKAFGVKDAVVSRLGYGGTEEPKTPREPVDHEALMEPEKDDKSLSEVISRSVSKEPSHTDDVSDQHQELMATSKVTESEEVAERLGTSEAERKGDLTRIPGSDSPKRSVLDNIKGAVSTLWSSGDETLADLQTSTQKSTQHETVRPDAGVKRIQDSDN